MLDICTLYMLYLHLENLIILRRELCEGRRMKREKLVRARIKKGLSQKVAAELIGVSRNTWSLWELGKEDPYPVYVEKLCTFFNIKEPSELDLEPRQLRTEQIQESTSSHTPPSLLHSQTSFEVYDHPQQFLPQHSTSLFFQTSGIIGEGDGNEPKERGMDEQRRRVLQQLLDTITGAAVVLSPQMTVLLGISGTVLSIPTTTPLLQAAEDIVSFCAKNITACWQSSKGDRHEMLAAKQIISSYLPTLTTLATQPASQDQQLAAHLASQYYRLRSLLGYHLENLVVAEEHANHAILYSQLANDPELSASAFIHSAFVYYYMKRPEQALERCQDALRYQDRMTHALLSLLYRIQAACEGQLHLEKKSIESLGLAYDHFSKHPANRQSSVHTSYDHYEMALWNGITHHHLGHYDTAQKALESADPLNASSLLPERVRTGFLNNLMFAELQKPAKARDMERCITLWTEAITRAMELGSELRLQEAYQAYKGMLMAFPNEQRVRHLIDRVKV
jgi:transcriptional regulator with XRE-family HTH domain/tetratricopeptide (TPR) repeat protein